MNMKSVSYIFTHSNFLLLSPDAKDLPSERLQIFVSHAGLTQVQEKLPTRHGANSESESQAK
jgi:hypothetical protein